MDALMRTDNPGLVAALDAAPQDVWMVDSDSKTYLYLHSQGSAAIKNQTHCKFTSERFQINRIKCKNSRKFNSHNLFSTGKGRTINGHIFDERKTTHENIYSYLKSSKQIETIV